MAQAKGYKIDMCSGPILSKMILFAVPLMFSTMLQLLFNAADIVVVGRFAGDNSMAAVGSVTALINLLINLFIGLSVGANVMAARYFASKRDDELSQTVHTAMTLSFAGGIFLAIVGNLFAGKILVLMQSPPEIIGLSTLYLKIFFLGMPANLAYNFGSALLRAVGDTRRPLYFLSLAGVINVVLNLVFVIKFHMDVAGVAVATVVSQCVSALLVIRCLMNETGGMKFELSKLGINPQKLIQIMKVGLPAGFQGILFSLSNVVIQSSINSFGEIVVAGSSASNNIEHFVYAAMNSVYQATLSFTSQNAGVGNFRRVRRIAVISNLYVIVLGIIVGGPVLLFGKMLISVYSSSAAVIEQGYIRLFVMMIVYFIAGMMDNMVGLLRGIGYSVMPMIVSLVGVCGFRLLWIATIFQLPQFHTIEMVYLSYPISWTVTFIIHFICYRKVINKVEAHYKMLHPEHYEN